MLPLCMLASWRAAGANHLVNTPPGRVSSILSDLFACCTVHLHCCPGCTHSLSAASAITLGVHVLCCLPAFSISYTAILVVNPSIVLRALGSNHIWNESGWFQQLVGVSGEPVLPVKARCNEANNSLDSMVSSLTAAAAACICDASPAPVPAVICIFLVICAHFT